MKKNNETWLSFFKKTLKVTGFSILILISGTIIIISFIIYNSEEYDGGKTHLNCEDRYLAFNNYIMHSQWNSLEEAWEVTLDITKINKSVVEVEFPYGGNTAEGEKKEFIRLIELMGQLN